MPSLMTRANLRALARVGAMQRLEELKQEESAIRAAFPDLFRGRPAGRSTAATGDAPKKRRRRRSKMSPAQRKAVSERMRKYWADRRKAKKG